MFQGSSKLNLDGKGRMIVPSRHRDVLKLQSEGRLTLTRHWDGCLLMFPRPVWETARSEVAAWGSESKRWQRMLLGNAVDVEMDGAGRVLISPELREAIDVAPDATVMLVGIATHFEIWEVSAHARNLAAIAEEAVPAEVKNFSY